MAAAAVAVAFGCGYCSSNPCSPNPIITPSQFIGQNFHQSYSANERISHILNKSKRTTTRALFWNGPRKAVAPNDADHSLGHFTLTGSAPEGVRTNSGMPEQVSVSVVSSVLEVPPHDWDACNLDSTGPEKFNPFLSHGFLSSLEETGCAVKETGWIPQHIIAQDEHQNILGVAPVYLKSHSYGEYVFDHSWANAYYSYGARYYPKLQCCVPFTPVTGPRILLRDSPYKTEIFDIIVSGMMALTLKFQVSSLHVAFPLEAEWERMKGKGFLQRTGMQYHWKNRNYKKWGTPYLTRDFFHNMASKLGDNVMLVVAEEGDEIVAGALNLIGGDTLFGRLWGCLPRAYYPSLHFEACYYQAMEAAIELNLDKVEAGAQGEHKIQRGYMPVTTYSCHYIVDEDFRKIIDDFLARERMQVTHVNELIHDSGPFKEGTR